MPLPIAAALIALLWLLWGLSHLFAQPLDSPARELVLRWNTMVPRRDPYQ
jgi:hypothetical protein